eukprot:jgi/Ulvmu1/5294/UM022_0088.1
MSVRRLALKPPTLHLRAAHDFHSRRCVLAQHRTQETSSWGGLSEWRSFVDSRRGIGPKGITNEVTPDWEASVADAVLPATLAERAVVALNTADPCIKAAITHRIFRDIYDKDKIAVGHARPPDCPARLPRPELVPALDMPKPKQTDLPLAVYMLHQLAHIELNAINLAWDTVARFSHLNLPTAFYMDLARVADDEGRHFSWCVQRIRELGHDYGAMPAHDLLWEGCRASAADVSARLAIVPMSQEARGLDAGPRLVGRLVGMGDNRTAAIVRRISEEERSHVAVGVLWFRRICAALGHGDGGVAWYRQIVGKINPDASILKGPFNHDDRQLVGFPREWYMAEEWPEEDRSRLLNTKYLSGPSYNVLSEQLLSNEELDLLRTRLACFCETEDALVEASA